MNDPMHDDSLICKSCAYHAGLKLPRLFGWLSDCSYVLDDKPHCIVCEDGECGPWIQIHYLEVDLSATG